MTIYMQAILILSFIVAALLAIEHEQWCRRS